MQYLVRARSIPSMMPGHTLGMHYQVFFGDSLVKTFDDATVAEDFAYMMNESRERRTGWKNLIGDEVF